MARLGVPWEAEYASLAIQHNLYHWNTLKQRYMVHGHYCSMCGSDELAPMLMKSVWNRVNNNSPHGFLCVPCIEYRLQRKLVLEDILPCHFSYLWDNREERP